MNANYIFPDNPSEKQNFTVWLDTNNYAARVDTLFYQNFIDVYYCDPDDIINQYCFHYNIALNSSNACTISDPFSKSDFWRQLGKSEFPFQITYNTIYNTPNNVNWQYLGDNLYENTDETVPNCPQPVYFWHFDSTNLPDYYNSTVWTIMFPHGCYEMISQLDYIQFDPSTPNLQDIINPIMKYNCKNQMFMASG